MSQIIMDRKRLLTNTGQVKELHMDGPGVFMSTLHRVEVNGINDSMERIERYLRNRHGDEVRFSDNGLPLINGERKTIHTEKEKLPSDWKSRLRILNLRERY